MATTLLGVQIGINKPGTSFSVRRRSRNRTNVLNDAPSSVSFLLERTHVKEEDMAHRFRTFLRDLRPGEIGFCIASVGTISAGLLLSNKISQARAEKEREREREWKKMVRHVDRIVMESTPVVELAKVKYYMRRLRRESGLPIEDDGREGHVVPSYTHHEIADEWVRRRNEGDKDAFDVEQSRLRLKRFWHTVERCVRYHQQHRLGDDDKDDDDTSILTEVLAGGTGKKDPNDRLVLKTLFFLENLDRACCRNHPKCVWSRDAPSFYSLLRRNAGRSEASWPGPYANDDDFDPDAPDINTTRYFEQYNAVPDSRLCRDVARKRQGA